MSLRGTPLWEGEIESSRVVADAEEREGVDDELEEEEEEEEEEARNEDKGERSAKSLWWDGYT